MLSLRRKFESHLSMGTKSKRAVLAGVMLLLAAVSCTPRLHVTPLKKERAYKNGYDVYYLPQTVLEVAFTLSKGEYTPGPYAAYAESLLGIAGDAPQQGTYWGIDSIAITAVQEPDYAQAFAVKISRKAADGEWLKLSRMGVLLPANAAPRAASEREVGVAELPGWPAFTDLSPAQFVADKSSIFYSTVQHDTTFVRVPVQRSVVVKETVAEKAKQAADLIFSLRKKRVELISGDAEIPAAQNVLRDMLSSINQLEAQYLSLFIGRWEYSKQTARLRYTPTPEASSSMLCRFSKQSGIRPMQELAATPVLITVTPLEGAAALPDDAQLKPLRNALYYRPPRMAEVTITLLRDKLASVRVPLAQFGPVVPMYNVPTE